ncbi:aminotransferase class I/II-fold pyridoxal phosphate-dependent enzyme [Catellatospora sp. NPDC049111]|uniref:dTDP-4-amino-4,6-dideoxygalactose transaminase n=1 Tax=Catellatospora coxensis TaxID=310354 RepID=A0A8J3KT18_9ACTN|nr:aminotransferase class I/II-fold pyridoxal phosphate-dependent enzyme [Catellatospora coxensis]GIG05698.1 hypothetical protein Cco03nite_23980 [Catellatospora coxensis]
MTTLAARGGAKTLDIPGPHYRWPDMNASLEQAIIVQAHRSLSDRDASGIIGELEKEFAKFASAEHVVSFASGTAAIHAMGRIADLKPGDAIIAPAYTFLATASPFAFDGIEVIFADADEYGNVTAASIEAVMAPNVRAVIVTHMWGNPCAMTDIAAYCESRGLLLFEDCSHAHFASWNGQRIGTFGDMAVFSTNQKAITTGEGGLLTTRLKAHRDLAILYAHYNKRALSDIDRDSPIYPFAFTGMGLKHRITTIGAAIGVHQLQHAADIEKRRRANLATFVDGLTGNPVLTPVVVPPEHGTHGLYVIGFAFHPQAATVTRDEFIDLVVAEGAREVDAPGSTRNLAGEPLFQRHDPYEPWTPRAAGPAPALPGVEAFESTFLKIPIWGYPGDTELVDGYLASLLKVTEAVAR